MLKINVGETEVYNEETEEFSLAGGIEVELEHSLVSMSKWESHYEKPFLGKEPKSSQEALFYIECMILSPEKSPEVISQLTDSNVEAINAYIESKQTATWFAEVNPSSPNREVVTAELLYYWMISFQIPIECQHWHLNRLLTLIKVCNHKNAKPKKMSPSELAERNRRMNAERKARLGTSG